MAATPTLILTRPRRASEALARELDVPVIISPVLEIVGTGTEIDLSNYRGVILTSSNAVSFLPSLAGVPVYCVGPRTAQASGGDVRLIAQDAEDLISRLDATGPLLHVHGRETRGDIAERLSLAGIETHSTVIYEQEPLPLENDAIEMIESDRPAVLPLFSPRSADRVARQVNRIGPHIHVIAMSQAVADVWQNATGQVPEIAQRPDGDAMFARIVAALSLGSA